MVNNQSVLSVLLASVLLLSSSADAFNPFSKINFDFLKNPFQRGDTYNKTVEYMFKKLDKNKDGFIDKEDIDKFTRVNSTLAFFKDERKTISAFMARQFKALDADNNNKISKAEFVDKLSPLKSQEYTFSYDKCVNTKAAVKKCKKEFKKSSYKNINFRIRTFASMCKIGVSAAIKYPVETCVENAKSCEETVQCYSRESADSIRKNAPSLYKRQYVSVNTPPQWPQNPNSPSQPPQPPAQPPQPPAQPPSQPCVNCQQVQVCSYGQNCNRWDVRNDLGLMIMFWAGFALLSVISLVFLASNPVTLFLAVPLIIAMLIVGIYYTMGKF